MRAELLSYAAQVLGQCTAVQDCSWDHAQSAVLRMRDAEGTSWFLKRHREAERYRTEVDAYRNWVPAPGDRAPSLVASHNELQAMIVSAVPVHLAIGSHNLLLRGLGFHSGGTRCTSRIPFAAGKPVIR